MKEVLREAPPPQQLSTPEAIERRRKLAQALMLRGNDYSPIQSWTQGLARVADAWVGAWQDKRADDDEKALASHDADLRKGLLDSFTPPDASASFSAPSPVAQPDYSPGAVQSAPIGAAGPAFDTVAPRLVSDLSRDFNLSPQAAVGVVGSLAGESGGFSQLQEKNPVVPGSLGGWGYGQWTGPRRQAFQAYSAQNGLDPASYEANYGFLKHELTNTPEGKVLDSLRGTQNPAEAMRVFTSQYERPGIPNLDGRQRWTDRVSALVNALQTAQQNGPVQVASADPSFAPPLQNSPAAIASTQDAAPPLANSPARIGATPNAQTPAAQSGQLPMLGFQGPASNAPPPSNVQALPPVVTGGGDASSTPQQKIAQALLAQNAAPVAAVPPGQQRIASALFGNAQARAALTALSDPYASEGTRQVAQFVLQQSARDPNQAALLALQVQKAQRDLAAPQTDYGFQSLPDGTVLRTERHSGQVNPVWQGQQKPTGDIQDYEYYAAQEKAAGRQPMGFGDFQQAIRRSGATNIDLGGGSDKQVFDAVKEGYDTARVAANGLAGIREARRALDGGGIFGAGADARLGLQKVGALLGIADPQAIQDTETFRAAIAPQVAAMLKATVGTANISNSDREFAEKAAGGSIDLDRGSIARLLDIMERTGRNVIAAHRNRLDKVYPDNGKFVRERALFGIDEPPAASNANQPGIVPEAAINALRQNPELAGQFDAKYGPGAAARVLGGQ